MRRLAFFLAVLERNMSKSENSRRPPHVFFYCFFLGYNTSNLLRIQTQHATTTLGGSKLRGDLLIFPLLLPHSKSAKSHSWAGWHSLRWRDSKNTPKNLSCLCFFSLKIACFNLAASWKNRYWAPVRVSRNKNVWDTRMFCFLGSFLTSLESKLSKFWMILLSCISLYKTCHVQKKLKRKYVSVLCSGTYISKTGFWCLMSFVTTNSFWKTLKNMQAFYECLCESAWMRS